jgi:hypothetical protein
MELGIIARAPDSHDELDLHIMRNSGRDSAANLAWQYATFLVELSGTRRKMLTSAGKMSRQFRHQNS